MRSDPGFHCALLDGVPEDYRGRLVGDGRGGGCGRSRDFADFILFLPTIPSHGTGIRRMAKTLTSVFVARTIKMSICLLQIPRIADSPVESRDCRYAFTVYRVQCHIMTSTHIHRPDRDRCTPCKRNEPELVMCALWTTAARRRGACEKVPLSGTSCNSIVYVCM